MVDIWGEVVNSSLLEEEWNEKKSEIFSDSEVDKEIEAVDEGKKEGWKPNE